MILNINSLKPDFMAYTKVLVNFSTSKYTDLELIAKGEFIIEHVTGNTHFPTPFPLLTELTEATEMFNNAYTKAEDGSKEDTVNKNNMRAEYEYLLKKVARYVETESNGDEASIVSAGFDVPKKPDPVGPLNNPTGLVVRYGMNSGEVIIECDPVKNSRMYDFQFTQSPVTPNSVWTNVSCTKRKVNVNGLSRGVEYVFRVAGMNSDPSRNWSEPVSKLVV